MGAKSRGKVPVTVIATDVRMGKPSCLTGIKRSEPRELKHLSTWRNRNQRDFPSSGERKGKSLNHVSVIAVRRCLQWGRGMREGIADMVPDSKK